MPDVTPWLRGLGREEYATAFVENEVDELSLPSLTAENLRNLGVTAIGHERRLLDAIAALRADANATIIPPSATLRQPNWLFLTRPQFGGLFDLEDFDPPNTLRGSWASGVASPLDAHELAGRNPQRMCRPPKGRGQSR